MSATDEDTSGRSSLIREALFELAVDFVDNKFPKNETSAHGGPATPGRGEAIVLLTEFVCYLTNNSGAR